MIQFKHLQRFILIPATVLLLNTFCAAQAGPPLAITLDQVDSVSCNGAADGAIFITIEGGLPPYTILWNNGSSDEDLFGLSGGAYTCLVTDSGVETASITVNVDEPNALSTVVDGYVRPDCFGDDGFISVHAEGGVAPFSYQWSNSATTNFLSGILPPGNVYGLTVTDAHNCNYETTYDLTSLYPSLTPSVAGPAAITCINPSIQLELSAASNNPAGTDYSVLWSAFNGGNIVSNLDSSTVLVNAAGSYVVTLTHLSSGCSLSDTATVAADTLPPFVGAGTDFTMLCSNSQSTLSGVIGSADPGAYAFWHAYNGGVFVDSSSTGTYSNSLTPTIGHTGVYVLTAVNPGNGCSAVDSLQVGSTFTAPAIQAQAGTITCGVDSARLVLSYAVDSLLFNGWTGPNGFTSNNTTPYVYTGGWYTASVSDTVTGCSNSVSIQVAVDSVAPDLVLPSVIPAISCAQPVVNLGVDVDSIYLNAPYAYGWSGPNGFAVDSNYAQIATPGSYQILVTNTQNGCFTSAGVQIDVDSTYVLANAGAGAQVNCLQPTATLSAAGSTQGAQISYNWTTLNGNIVSGANTQNPVADAAGTYVLLVTNAFGGCTAVDSVQVSADLTAPTVNATGGNITCLQNTAVLQATTTAPASLNWTGPNGFTATGTTATASTSGVYTITAVDSLNGCVSTATIEVLENTNVPVASAGADDYLNCKIFNVRLNGAESSYGDQFTYLWTTTDGHFLFGETDLAPRVDSAGTYVLMVTDTITGCVAFDTVLVIQRPPVTVSIDNVQNVLCYGGASGSVAATAGGGAGGYVYGWSNGSAVDSIVGLSAGTYTVVVVDADACSASAQINITQPAPLYANASATGESFGGMNDGTASATGSGGTAPYSYLWSNGAMVDSISGLAPGNYIVSVTDANGCVSVETVTVNASNCFLSATIVHENISCFGAGDGSLSLAVLNAPDPVQYSWSNGGSAASISDLGPGVYTATITDGNGCSIIKSAEVLTPAPLAANIVLNQDAACVNVADGFLAAALTGGTQPYAYAWSNGSTAPLATNLSAGTYTLSATDAQGCTMQVEGTIGVSDTIAPFLYVHDFLFSLDLNGEVNLIPEYFISAVLDAQCDLASVTVSPNFFDCDQLGQHTVTITATDVNGNSISRTATLTIVDNAYPILSCPPSATVGLCDAFISYATPTVSDNCTVDPGLLHQTAGLPSGVLFPVGTTQQSFSYTDAAGNIGICNFSITVVENPQRSISVQDASCAADCNGTAALTITGGQSPYSVQWSTGASGLSVGNLCPGNYSYSITDGLGCVTIYTFTVGEDDNITPTLILKPASVILEANGQATVNPLIFNNGSFDNCGIASWSVSPSVVNCTGVGSQTVTVTAIDFNGNSVSGTAILTVIDNVAPSLTCPSNIVAGSCNPVIGFGFPTFFDNCTNTPVNMSLISGFPSGSAFPQGTTTQVYRAYDNSGNSATCSFTVTVAEPISMSLVGVSPSCNNACNGSVTVAPVHGVPPYIITWSNGQNGVTADNLCAGTYTCTVTDAAGCTKVSTFALTQPTPLILTTAQVNNDVDDAGVGSINVNITGGSLPYVEFKWTKDGVPFASTEDLSGLHMGVYALVVTDANGCTATITVTVTNTVDASEPEWATALRIFPNPADAFINVQFDGNAPDALEISLTDGSGRQIRTLYLDHPGAGIRFDLSDIPAGIWFLRLRSAEQGQIVRKIVVE